MKIVSLAEASRRLKSILDRVTADADVTIIKRPGAADVVLMPLEHYSSLVETVHLLGVPANASHLAESIRQHKDGKVFDHHPLDADSSD